MRSNFLPLVVIAGMTFGGAAFADTTAATTTAPATTTATTTAKPATAAPMVAATPVDFTGAITKISTKGHYIVLSDGNKYHVSKTFSLAAFKVGEKVTVTYTMKGKVHMASAVKAAA